MDFYKNAYLNAKYNYKEDIHLLNVLSLFDGISCGQVALERVGIKVDTYYASEIKKTAIKVTKLNYPNTIHIGDVTKVSYNDGILYTENGEYNIGKIDLLIGGSPCQDFAVCRLLNGDSRDGLEGKKSRLFYEYLRIKKECNPTYFLLENVKMKKESEIELNNYIGIKGLHINSILVSYQNRERIYWTNIPNVTIPEDKNINFQDYKDTDYNYCKAYKVPKTPSRERMWNSGSGRSRCIACPNVTYSKKINCITRKQDRQPNSGLIEFDNFCRFLTPHELEQGQTLPIGYTDCLSYRQAQDVIGDGWTVDVIVHILKNIT